MAAGSRGATHRRIRARASRFHVVFNPRGRQGLLGRVRSGRLLPSPIGRLVEQAILDADRMVEGAIVLESQVMPNHVHLVVDLRESPTSLGGFVGRIRAQATREARRKGLIGDERLWIPNFWDRELRTDEEVDIVIAYVRNNLRLWRG